MFNMTIPTTFFAAAFFCATPFSIATAAPTLTDPLFCSCASNDSDATLMLGISTDTNSILAAAVIGDSSVPVEKTVANFATTNTTGKLSKDEILVLTVDYDGSAGTAAADLSVLITLLEG